MKTKVIPQLILEKYIQGEADAEEKVLVEQSLEENPDLQKRLDEIRLSDEEILQTYPPAFMTARIKEGLKQKEKKPSFSVPLFRGALAFSMAAALLLVFFFSPAGGRQGLFHQPEVIRLKGDPALKIFEEQEEEPLLLKNRDKIANYSTVQLIYAAGNYSYGTIISIDGRGAVTLHFPYSNTGSLKLTKGGEVPLEYSYELDDAPDFERFFFILSEKEFSLSTIMARARVLAADKERGMKGSLPLPRDFEQISILLLKEN